jgi:hypothetical protein
MFTKKARTASFFLFRKFENIKITGMQKLCIQLQFSYLPFLHLLGSFDSSFWEQDDHKVLLN